MTLQTIPLDARRRSRRWRALSTIIAVASVAAAAAHLGVAQAQGDPGRGLAVATRWCNSCHMISPTDSWDDGEFAPRFSTLTRQTVQTLKQLLAPGHADMDALSKLTEAEIADIVAYLHRLKPEPSTPR